MKAIVVTLVDDGLGKGDKPIAIVECHQKLKRQFVKSLQSNNYDLLRCEDEWLGAQTFVAWLRSHDKAYQKKSLYDCLDQEEYTWSDPMDILNVAKQGVEDCT